MVKGNASPLLQSDVERTARVETNKKKLDYFHKGNSETSTFFFSLKK